MKKLKAVILIFVPSALLLLTSNLLAQEDFKLFNEGMELRIQREWDKALEKYEQLKLQHPNSKYVDDADFWSAYILEEQGKESEAFSAYQQMKKKHPESPWADDATMHQIGLAEKFVKKGENSYKPFLTEHLESPNKNVKYQAALSLGKLGDDRAIPVLKEISNNGDKDMRSVGSSLLQKFEKYPLNDNSRIRPIPDISQKKTSKKNNDQIKMPQRIEPQKQRQTPTKKQEIKANRPAPKQKPPSRTPQPKKTAPTRKGKEK